MLQFVKGHERFAIELEIEYGLPGISVAFDHVSVTVTQGQRTKRSRYPAYETAARKYHEAIAAQLDVGFALEVDGVRVEAHRPATFTAFPELEECAEDRGADADWSALADAWREVGDPRGECIHGENRLAGLNDVAQFLQQKVQVEASRRVRNAYIWGVLGRDAYRLRVTSRKGLVERLLLDDELGAPGRPTAELVAAALASPFARFVRDLRVVRSDEHELDRVIANSPRAGRVTVAVFEYP